MHMSFTEVEKPPSFLKKYIDKLNNHEDIRVASDPEGNNSPNRINAMTMWHVQSLLIYLKLSRNSRRKSDYLSVGWNGQCFRNATSYMFKVTRLCKSLPAIVLLFLFSVHSEAQNNASKETLKPQVSVTPTTSSHIEKENFKKRTPEEIFEALNAVLRAMNDDMEEFNFDKVHPHLKIIYSLYNELRLLSLDNIDSLVAHPGKIDSTLLKRSSGSPHYKISTGMDSLSTRYGSSVTMVIDTSNLSGASASQRLSIGPRIDLKNLNPSRIQKDSSFVGNVSSLAFSWEDTSFRKYLLKFEIVPDTTGAKMWNVVFEEVDKLKNKTTKIHQYFDLGEFAVSTQDLVWLTDELKKSETEMRGYFYYKEHEKKKEKKDTILLK